MFQILLIFILALVLIYVYTELNKKYHVFVFCRRLQTIDGKNINEYITEIPGNIFFGSLLEIIGVNSEQLFQIFRKYSAYAKRNYIVYAFGRQFLGTVLPEEAEIILTSTKILTKAMLYDALEPFLKTGLLTSFGSKWHNRRKLLTPAFHFSILQNFLKTFKNESQKFVDILNSKFETSNNGKIKISLTNVVPKFTLNSICEAALGVNLDNISGADNYRKHIHLYEQIVVKRITEIKFQVEILRRFIKNKQEQAIVKVLHNFSSNIIEERRKILRANANIGDSSIEEKRESIYNKKERYALLDLLLAAEADNQINHDGICEEVDTFMYEGFDTTSVGIIFSLFMLSINPECQEKCYDEISRVVDNLSTLTIADCNNLKYLECCIKETIRLFPSVSALGRICDEDFLFGNLILPKGTNISINVFDIHRDPRYYPDPEKFDPDRFLPENCVNRHPFAYIPFSAGPRNCIGQKFAMLEMKSLLIYIIKEFKFSPITNLKDIRFGQGIVLRTINNIEIEITKR